MKRNSVNKKAHSIDFKQSNQRLSSNVHETFVKPKFELTNESLGYYKAKVAEYSSYNNNATSNSNYKKSNQLNQLSQLNQLNQLNQLSQLNLTTKLRDELRMSMLHSIDAKLKSANYEQDKKHTVERESTNSIAKKVIPGLNDLRNSTRGKASDNHAVESSQEQLKRKPPTAAEETLRNWQNWQIDHMSAAFPKVTEKRANVSQDLQGQLKSLNGHLETQQQRTTKDKATASTESVDYQASKLSDGTISQGNATSVNKVVSLMPARCATFVFNGKEALYAVNTTNGMIRTYNEDRVSIVINVKPKLEWKGRRWPNCSYFSVFDGHGGSLCADFLKDNLHKMILENKHFPDNTALAIQMGFAQAEHEFCKFALKQTNIEKSGSCAVVLLIVDEKVYIGNVGDSRAIVSELRGQLASNLTRDHKPNDARERERIESSGGKVMRNNYLDNYKFLTPMLSNRLNELPFRVYPGGLSVSRSFGDVASKEVQLGGNPNALIAKPDIYVYSIDKRTDFIFVGCSIIRRRRVRQMGNEGDRRLDVELHEKWQG